VPEQAPASRFEQVSVAKDRAARRAADEDAARDRLHASDSGRWHPAGVAGSSQGAGAIVARYVLFLSVVVVLEKNDSNVVPIELRPS
jgi:hypothetical protein